MSDELNAAIVRALRTVDIPEDAFPVTVEYYLPVADPGTFEYEQTEIKLHSDTAAVRRQVSWNIEERA